MVMSCLHPNGPNIVMNGKCGIFGAVGSATAVSKPLPIPKRCYWSHRRRGDPASDWRRVSGRGECQGFQGVHFVLHLVDRGRGIIHPFLKSESGDMKCMAAYRLVSPTASAFRTSDCEIPNCRPICDGLIPALNAALTAFSLP